MQLLLLLIFRSIYGLIYEKEENRKISAKSVIHVEDDVPSELTCLHICLRLNSEALYTKKRCQCLGEMNVISNDTPLITGTYMQKTKKDDRMNDIAPVGIKRIAPVEIKSTNCGQLIAIISKMMKTFHIQAAFKIDHSGKIHQRLNIFYISIGSYNGRSDTRYSALNLMRHSVSIPWLHAYFRFPRRPPFHDSSFKVDYIQSQTNNGYVLRIMINDVTVGQRTVKDPREFENLYVYFCNPGSTSTYYTKNSTAIVRFIKGVQLKWRYDD